MAGGVEFTKYVCRSNSNSRRSRGIYENHYTVPTLTQEQACYSAYCDAQHSGKKYIDVTSSEIVIEPLFVWLGGAMILARQVTCEDFMPGRRSRLGCIGGNLGPEKDSISRDLGSSAERRAGSSPVPGTKLQVLASSSRSHLCDNLTSSLPPSGRARTDPRGQKRTVDAQNRVMRLG